MFSALRHPRELNFWTRARTMAQLSRAGRSGEEARQNDDNFQIALQTLRQQIQEKLSYTLLPNTGILLAWLFIQFF